LTPLQAQAGEGGGSVGDVKLVKSAERTIAILELLASAPRPLTAPEIFKQTGYPRSSLHWLLLTLQELNWIEQGSEGAYRIGTHALLCGTAYLDRDPVMEHVSGVLEKVRNSTTFTTHYARLDRSDVIYLATRQAVDRRRLSSRVGRKLPAQVTALGKAILSELTDSEVLQRIGAGPYNLPPTPCGTSKLYGLNWRCSAGTATPRRGSRTPWDCAVSAWWCRTGSPAPTPSVAPSQLNSLLRKYSARP